MASEESFSRVLRGYDPAEVDPLIQKLRRELLSAKTLHDETSAQLKTLETRYAELELEVDVKASPTVEGLSTKLNNKLKKADKLAGEIVRRAESDALLIRSAAEKTSSNFIEAARDGFEQTRAQALSLAQEMEKAARAEAAQIIAEAQNTASQLLSEAQADAQNLRGDASTDSANLRAESRNEAERIKADAQREAEELKLVLVANRDSKITVSKEILTILKLNADGAAVRAEMEKDIQARHQESVMQTAKYIAAAETQLATTKTRVRALETQIEDIQKSAESTAEALLEQARIKAAKEESSADKLARKKISDAEKYVTAVLASIYTQLESIRVEREAVAAFFDALRLELQQTLGDAAPTKKLDR